MQAATNGIEFAKDPEFAKEAAEAGLRYAYLQFDGIGNAANSHRRVGNLFDVKLRAIENLHSNGVDIVPVVTIVNGVNNEQVGRIIEFALDNPKKINFLSFQPVCFTGRDEEVTPERRAAQRYTLSHLAHDVKNQTGIGEPVRDWFPISFMGSFTDWADVTHGAEKEFGQLTCGCHPNCGVGMAIMIDKETKEAVPVTKFLKAERFAKDVQQVTDAGRSRFWSNFGMALAVVRNYDSFNSPTHFKLTDLLKKFDKTFGATKSAEKGKYGKVEGDRTMDDIAKRRADRWNFLFIAGMWFQDLFNYDFRRTEMCIIPYATQQGEISFCAYNTGIGWRNIIEKMHMTATLTKWYEEHGRHEIFAGGKAVPLNSTEHTLEAQRRSGPRRRADRPRGPRHREERARGEAAGTASTRRRRNSRAKRRTTPRWPSSIASTCSRSSRRCRFRGSEARRRRRSRPKSCTSRSCNAADFKISDARLQLSGRGREGGRALRFCTAPSGLQSTPWLAEHLSSRPLSSRARRASRSHSRSATSASCTTRANTSARSRLRAPARTRS